jgi:hypothetical protein
MIKVGVRLAARISNPPGTTLNAPSNGDRRANDGSELKIEEEVAPYMHRTTNMKKTRQFLLPGLTSNF